MISSVDLIEEQIRVAMGEKLRYSQVTSQTPICIYNIKVRPTSIQFIGYPICRKILYWEDIQLNAVLMQKMHSKTSVLDQVKANSYLHEILWWLWNVVILCYELKTIYFHVLHGYILNSNILTLKIFLFSKSTL